MTNYDLWGPWTGSALQIETRRTYLKHRSWALPLFLAVLALVTGALVALAGWG